MKKKIISIVLILTLMISNGVSAFQINKSFSDVSQNDWFSQNVSKLVRLNTIDGYEDGTFRPNDNIQADAFLKLIITALGNHPGEEKSYWAKRYIDKAISLKIIDKNEFEDYKVPINRQQMAKIIINALKEENSNTEGFKDKIKDYNSIPDNYKDYVLKAYVKGIIDGYEDGSFKGDRYASRAEATTLIIRFLYKETRTVHNQTVEQPIGTGSVSDNVVAIDERATDQVIESIKGVTQTDNGNLKMVITSQSKLSTLNSNDIFFLESTPENPLGYMGKIVSKSTNQNGEIVIEVSQPTIEEAFSELEFDTVTPIKKANIVASDLPKGATIEEDSRPLLAAGSGFNFLNVIKSLQYGSTKDPNNDNVFSEMYFNFDDTVVYDEDDNLETTNDQVKVKGKLSLKNASILTAAKYKDNTPWKWERFMARIIGTSSNELRLTVNKKGHLGLDSIIDDRYSNSINLGLLNVEGVKKETGKIYLGSITVGFGKAAVTIKNGETAKIPLGATIIFTTTLDGEVNSEIVFGTKYNCYIDRGFDITNINGEKAVTEYNVLAAKSYPNPNVTSVTPTKEQINSKPEVEYTVDINGKVNAKAYIGMDVGIIVLGIVPAKITNDFGQELNGNFKYKTGTDTIEEGWFTGESRTILKTNYIVRIAVNAWKFNYEDRYSGQIYENIFDTKTFNINKLKEEAVNPPKPEEKQQTNQEASTNTINKNNETYILGAGNNNNGGLITYRDGCIYYQKNENKQTSLYKKKMDGSDKILLCSGDIKYINTDENHVYYVKGTSFMLGDFDGGIFKVKEDGTSNQKLSNDNSCYLSINGEYLYYLSYSDQNSLCRIKTDGTGKTILSNNCSYYGIYNDKIYYVLADYSGNSGIYKMDLDGQNTTLIYKGDVDTINVLNNKIYFIENPLFGNNLYSIDIDGTNKSRIGDIKCMAINVSDKYIYYTTMLNGIYRVNLDGSDIQKISSEGDNIFLIGDYIFYTSFMKSFSYNLYKIKNDLTEAGMIE